MKGAACGRADLVRVLASGDEVLLAAVAGLVGFEADEPTAGATQPARGIRGDTGEASGERAPPLERQPSVRADVPFWRLEAVEEFSEDPQPEPTVTAEPIQRRAKSDIPPPIRPLAPWRALQPRLRQALTEQREGYGIDLEAIVARLSRGKQLERLPREHRRRWCGRLQLIEDRSERLIPYWSDQALVCAALMALVPPHALEHAAFWEGLSAPRRLGSEGAQHPYRLPPPGSQVLVLGDLGCLALAGSAARDPWVELGRRLYEADCRAVALVPGPLARCPEDVRRYWRLVPWERPRGAIARDRKTRRTNAERLLRLLSPAVRIEPGLLRAVRLLLGAEEADAGTEAEVWQHPWLDSTSNVAATLNAKAAEPLRAAFAREPVDLQRQVLERLSRWREALPREVWFEEVMSLAPSARTALPNPGDVAEASRFFEQLSQQIRGIARDRPAGGAVSWFRRCERRLPDSTWADDRAGPALQRLAWHLHRNEPDYRPPPGFEPALISDERMSLVTLAIVQCGGDLVFAPTATGSRLGTVRTRNGLIQVREGPSLGFWRDGRPPPWADDWGVDGFGPWVTFTVEGRNAGKVNQRMRWIEPGSFMMGSPEEEPGRYDDEGPRHEVTLSRGFWLFDTPCTQALWEAVMGNNPSRFQSSTRPVEQVSWDDIQGFLGRINERVPGLELVLPTEAQWEYACRAGTETAIYSGDLAILGKNNAPALDPIAWYGGNSGVDFDLEDGEDSSSWPEKQYPHERAATWPVALKQANAWGLYDMLGNVWEWIQDHWHDNYQDAPVDGSAWEDTEAGAGRVIRGGSWINDARDVRAAYRGWVDPGHRDHDLGFRCARVQVSLAGPAGAEPAGPAPGRLAERRPAKGQPDGAGVDEAAILLRLDTAQPQARCVLPEASAFLIRTDCERLTFGRLTKPRWASAIGRDRFGLWCEVSVDTDRGEPVIQRLRWIAPGRFWMGSPEDETQGLAKKEHERKWFDAEHPRHSVIITRGYWLFDTPCTQALWETVMGKNPSRFQSPTRPVERVSWDDIQDFLERINERVPGLELVLPTEAQWEYACRAGTKTAIYSGELAILGECNAPALDPIAWYTGNSGVDFDLKEGEHSTGWPEKQYPHERAGTRPVALKQANAWGLYDMLGNVWEWCRDGMRDYDEEARTDPVGSLEAGAERVDRGGSWGGDARSVRAAYRGRFPSVHRYDSLGFRCARVQG